MAGPYRVGIDIGGTFTDFVLIDESSGELRIHKRLTTPDDPARAALAGLAELAAAGGCEIADLAMVVHGTTLVTNAIIERTGARVGLLTTRGSRDVLEMGREQRYDIYDLFLQFPAPLVPRDLRHEVDERMSRDGEALLPLDAAQVRAALRGLSEQGVEAAAVCFLHAYRNPAHEQAVRGIAAEEFPELSVSISSEVAPEIGEYERSVTTVANAYVQPLVSRYLEHLEAALTAAGFRGNLYLMQSSGGSASPRMARELPVRLLESGPAGGALATAFLGALIGRDTLLAFDMGGTTAKACLIAGGRPEVAPAVEAARVHRFHRGSGLPIRTPVIDMIEIGAGGGSISRCDDMGLLKVGPRSAGAAPGPACYGQGGAEPTVTDANLLLGYLDPGYFLGGRMTLDVAAARAALERLAAELHLGAVETAWGIHSVVNENMAAAARNHIVEKGKDPRRFAMVAFGGAGPAHAARVARILGMAEVIVPPAAGAASALGFLAAPISFEFAQSLPSPLEDSDWEEVNRALAAMEARGRELLAEAGIAGDQIRVRRTADMRLLGQVHEITVPIPLGALGPANVPGIEGTFADEYRRLYSHIPPGIRTQVLNWRLEAAGPQPEVSLGTAAPPAGTGARKGSRPAFFPEAGGFVETAVYDRYRLAPDMTLHGPAIVEEREATTILSSRDHLTVDAYGNLRITLTR